MISFSQNLSLSKQRQDQACNRSSVSLITIFIFQKKIEMIVANSSVRPRLVYFDGTIESAGRVLAACNCMNRPVLIVVHRQLDRVQESFLNALQDCTGSIGDFVNGRFTDRRRKGSARQCDIIVDDGVDALFEFVAQKMDHNEEDAVNILSCLYACYANNCGKCEMCHKVARISEEYGVYDVFDIMRSY